MATKNITRKREGKLKRINRQKKKNRKKKNKDKINSALQKQK